MALKFGIAVEVDGDVRVDGHDEVGTVLGGTPVRRRFAGREMLRASRFDGGR